MKLIQLPTQALEERIQEELEVNPALETESQVDEDPYETDYDNSEDEYSSDKESDEYSEIQDVEFSEELFDDTPEYKLNANNYSADDETYEAPIVARQDLSDVLQEQRQNHLPSSEDDGPRAVERLEPVELFVVFVFRDARERHCDDPDCDPQEDQNTAADLGQAQVRDCFVRVGHLHRVFPVDEDGG